MKLHWKVLIGMLLGLLAGLALQAAYPAPAWLGATFVPAEGGVAVDRIRSGSPVAKAKLQRGDVLTTVILGRGSDEERTIELREVSSLVGDGGEESSPSGDCVLGMSENGDVVWFLREGQEDPVAVALGMDPSSTRARLIEPVAFVADIFLALLKMLIVPLILSSIVAGVASVGTMKDLKRLGGKAFAYYMSTSLLAVVVGQLLVSLIAPGEGAQLGLSPAQPPDDLGQEGVFGIFKRMVPENIFSSLMDNGQMLQVIFFALLLGYFITLTDEPHRSRIGDTFASFMEVMMKMAEGVLQLLPYGVFALIVKVVASTGFGVFKPLLLYMLTVTLALVLHAAVTLPLLLKLVGRVSPIAWFKAMSPTLLTAFSTSSSSMTLPVNMRNVEGRGRVSNKVTSFTLPLGATINMDGTALYECIGVVFLAQYYVTQGSFDLTLTGQALVVVMALLASVGAAGIPSAGLVMMLTILSALGLPLEGAALLLAVDRPLDMLRTVVNVWSDTCGAAIIARSEGEEGPAQPLTDS